MSNGFSGASRINRRRRWLSLQPEDSPPESVSRPRSPVPANVESTPDAEINLPVPVSSLLPRRNWVLSLLVLCGLLSWTTVVGVGAWLDIQKLDPWREIFGIQSGRLLRFYTTIALLTCAQLSYLILWRRSNSRKDFAGRYRVWFWVGAVCSMFCVASATGFHRSAASHLTRGMSLVWVEAATACWLVPATTLLLSAMHLMRRDMLYRSASTSWTQVSRGLAVLSGMNLLFGSLLWPVEWVTAIDAALGALWPTVFASTLLIHARYVTYVTNEASRELRQPSRTTRWEARLRAFAQHIALQVSEEWQLYRQKRAAAQVASLSTPVTVVERTPTSVRPGPRGPGDEAAKPESVPQPSREQSPRERSAPQPTPSQRTSAPLQQMSQSRPPLDDDDLDETPAAAAPAPVTTAINARPLTRPAAPPPSAVQPTRVHPAQPIPAPHFAIDEPALSEDEATGENESESQSLSIPAGYTSEQWRNLSKKDRKRLRRTESVR